MRSTLLVSFLFASVNDVPEGIPIPRSTFGACVCRQRQINGILAQSDRRRIRCEKSKKKSPGSGWVGWEVWGWQSDASWDHNIGSY